PRAHTARAIVERLPRAARTRLVPLTGRVAHAVIGGRPHDPTHWMERPHPSERLWWRIENNTESGALRFNVVGRERDGKVEPHDLRAHEDWLDQQLLQIVNVDSGERLIRRVFRTAELYRRRPDDGLPDMIIEWNRDTPIERIWSPLIGQICRPDTNWRSGEHSPHGTLICVGPGVVPGVQGEIRPTDVAPTVARAFGVDLPGVDGHAIETLVPSAPAVPARANAAVATPPVLSDRILATSAWIRQARLATDPLVSVILPTLDRRDRLPRAAQSVLTQRYQNLELVVVDDGSRDGTADWLAGVEDPRLVVARSSKPRGEGGARNAGLERATGELIAFLDDDNAFDPDWLRSVVWFFERQPDASVVYGARVIDGAPPGEPHLQLNKWTPIGTRWNSLVDMNVIAHRRCGVRFDADLDLCADWDYLNQLTIGRDVVAHQLPVIATYYSTDAPGRRSDVDAARWDAIHSLMHARWGAPVGG
ncbi:MAG TPA: glycosyltransferase, partial [Ilumatobacteraceae bacterium]